MLGARSQHASYMGRYTALAARSGFEPLNAGVKVLCLTAWRPGYIKQSTKMCLYLFMNARKSMNTLTGLYIFQKLVDALCQQNKNTNHHQNDISRT